MTKQEMLLWVITAVLFITVVLGGVFATSAASIWFRNRREERRNTVRAAEARSSERFNRERDSWLAILAEKVKELERLNEMVSRLEKNYEIATRILQNAEPRKENV